MPSGHVFVNQLPTGQVSGVRMPGGHVAMLRSHSLDHRELEFSGLLTSTGWLR